MKDVDVKKQADHVERHCVGSSLRKLNRVITAIFNSEFAAVGITSSQFNILTAVAKMNPASPVKIAKVLHLEKSSLSRNLELMRRNGWLHAEGNSRVIQLTMTAEGKEIYAKAFPHWEKAQTMSQRILGKEVAKNLRSVITSLQAG